MTVKLHFVNVICTLGDSSDLSTSCSKSSGDIVACGEGIRSTKLIVKWFFWWIYSACK